MATTTAAAADTTGAPATAKVCPDCGERRSVDEFPNRRRDGTVGHTRCRDCQRARKRKAEQARSGDPFAVNPPHAPDNTPARTLRVELAHEREQGAAFEDAWQTATEHAIASAKRADRGQWEEAFQWSKATWRAAYTWAPFVCRMPFLDF